MIVPYVRIICKENLRNSKECVEFVNKPVLTFLNWDLDRQASFLLHQSLIIRYMENISANGLSKPMAQYKEFLKSAKIRFELNYPIKIKSNEDVIRYDRISTILSFILGYITNSNTIGFDEISYFFKTLDPKGLFYKTSISFSIPFMTHLKILGDKIKLTEESILDQDSKLFQESSVPVITIHGRHVLIRYISLGKYEFNPELIREHIKLLGSGLDFLACCDWSGKKFLHVLGYLATFVWDFNPRHFQGNIPLSTYYHIHRILFNLKANIHIVITNNYYHSYWFKTIFVDFLKILRVEYNIEFNAPQILGRILSGDEDSDHNGLANYLISGIGNPNNVSNEDYNTFLNSAFNFEELDIRKGVVSSEADDDPDELETDDGTDDVGDDTPADDNDNSDNADDSDEGTEPPKDDDSDSDDPDENSDDTSNNEPEPNINTSDKTGIAFELSEEETLDSVIFRREVSTYISHLLEEKKLPSEKLEILKKLKMYWLNLLSVKTIQDIIKSVKHV